MGEIAVEYLPTVNATSDRKDKHKEEVIYDLFVEHSQHHDKVK